MKNKLFILLLSLTFSFVTNAQKRNDNTLSTEIQKADKAFEKKDYTSAVNYYVAVADKIHTTDIRTYVRMNIMAVRCYAAMKQYDKVVELTKQLLNEKLTNAEREEVEQLLYDNALIQASTIIKTDSKRYLEARAIYDDIKIYAKGDELKRLNTEIQNTYIIEGRRHITDLNFEKALNAFEEASVISDDESQQLAISYNVGSIYYSMGEYDDAINYFNNAINLAYKTKDAYIHYMSLRHEREVYKRLDDMQHYYSLGVKLDSLMSNSNDNAMLADYYEYQGSEWMSVGNYDIAEAYFSRLPELFPKINNFDKVESMKTNYYSRMRDLKRKQKDYEAAIEYNEKLNRKTSKIYDNSNFNSYLTYFFHTQIYSEMKDIVNFERAVDSLNYACTKTTDVFNRALTYNMIGAGYSKLDKGEKALEYYDKAEELLASKYNETFDMRMILLDLYAGELKKLKRYDEACAKYKKYVELVARVNGKNSNQYSSALFQYANSLRISGQQEGTAALYTESMDILEAILRSQLRYVPSNERYVYINTFWERLWMIANSAIDYKDTDKEFVKRCYNSTVMLKSLIFESDMSMYNTLQLKGTDEDVSDYSKMLSLRVQRKLLFRNYAKNKDKIDSLSVMINNIDKDLTKKSTSYSEYTSFLNFNYDDIRNNLGKNDVLFDFFDFDTPDGIHKYIVYVVKKDFDTPVLIDLFTEDDIDQILANQPIDCLYNRDKSSAVIELLWKQLSKYAKKGGNVYYVPSGIMYQISLESLPQSNGSLLGERYKFIRLTSAHRIADLENNFEGKKDAILYGGLRYDIDVAAMKQESMKFSNANLYTMRSTVSGTSKFTYLPSTLYETEKISKILKQNDYEVTTYTDIEGTEESFLSMHNQSPQILHVATHGFYYTPEEATRNNFLKGSSDAMLLSGLVLSGGNAAWLGKKLPQGVLGGVLSAGNISCLNLSDTELVVLSACQTGQGKVTREGLFGLQRAFKKAGVKTIVTTLWNVSDKVTSEFMVEFYNNLFHGKKITDKKKAFIMAKQSIRKKYPEPHYWAGFVMVD